MFCSKRRLTPCNSDNTLVVGSKELYCSEFREQSPVDDFMFQEIESNGVPSTRLTSDIYMLFNQQRLDRMSRERLLSHFDSMSVREPKFFDLRGKLGDEQLISFVKSRFIQSPSELMSWSQYLMSSSDEVIASLAAVQAAATPASTEPTPAPTD